MASERALSLIDSLGYANRKSWPDIIDRHLAEARAEDTAMIERLAKAAQDEIDYSGGPTSDGQWHARQHLVEAIATAERSLKEKP